jgi:hypothetical protein
VQSWPESRKRHAPTVVTIAPGTSSLMPPEAGAVPGEGRRSQVLGILRGSPRPLDDDQIAAAAQMNRVYVNMICRQLAAEGLIVRRHRPDGKLVNVPADGNQGQPGTPTMDEATVPRLRRRAAERGAERIEELIGSFAAFVTAFETSEAFPGPSLYFHLRAIERRRRHQTVTSLLADTQFLEYAYAVLPA